MVKIKYFEFGKENEKLITEQFVEEVNKTHARSLEKGSGKKK